jgi:hypothetical protein
MSKRNDLEGWGNRAMSRGPSQAAPAGGGQPQALPMPPPGYAWVFQPGVGFVLMPFGALAAPAAPPPAPAPAPAPTVGALNLPYAPYTAPYPPAIRQPDPAMAPYYPPAPYAQPVPPPMPRPAAPPRSCELVKPDGRDLYADLLATVPDLVPPPPHDPAQGPLPDTIAALQNTPEFVMQHRADLNPFGASAPARAGIALGAAAPPQAQPLPFTPAPPQQVVMPAPAPAYDPTSTVSTRPTGGRIN